MEHTAIFQEQVSLTPKDMRIRVESVEDLVRDKLKARLEGRCSRHGYVLPDTIKVLSRSMGSLEKGRFTGSIIFNIEAEGKVLNPPEGIIIEGEVIRKNKMGMYVSYKDAIRVIIPRDLHIGDEAFEAVEIGETVEVVVKKSRFQVNDPYILSVGVFRSSKGKGPKKTNKLPNVNTTFAPAIVEEEDDQELEEDAEDDEAEDEVEDDAVEDEELEGIEADEIAAE
jgi:DNA-directed RNA polymerase subunit E'/Rpb7